MTGEIRVTGRNTRPNTTFTKSHVNSNEKPSLCDARPGTKLPSHSKTNIKINRKDSARTSQGTGRFL